MDPGSDPLDGLICHLVPAEVQAAERLCLAEERGHVLQSWLDQARLLQIKVGQVNVLFDEIAEAGDNFEVELAQFNFGLASLQLLHCQGFWLFFQEVIVAQIEADKGAIIS